eukprot:1807815-Amphidinium_carterae.1
MVIRLASSNLLLGRGTGKDEFISTTVTLVMFESFKHYAKSDICGQDGTLRNQAYVTRVADGVLEPVQQRCQEKLHVHHHPWGLGSPLEQPVAKICIFERQQGSRAKKPPTP